MKAATTTQVILGSGGAIARPLAEALADYAAEVRCASRTPHAPPAGRAGVAYAHHPADLLDPAAAAAAVAGARVAYLTAGLAYDTAVWRRDWPRLVDNALAACAEAGARLVFFDNVYAYAASSYPAMREDAPIDPPSDKGAIRAEVLRRLWRAHEAGEVEVAVARAGDFYGPGIGNSLLIELIIKRLAAGKAAQWLRGNGAGAPLPSPDAVHSFTYTPDAGRHLALLGNDDRAYGESWHLPTAPDPWTPREWVERAAALLGVAPKLQVLPRWLWRGLAVFNRDLRELYDVRQQLAGPYVFDSGKFERAFGVRATGHEEGLTAVVEGLR